MFASLVYDAFAGLGCTVFAVGMTALACFVIALWLGLLPNVAVKLKQLGMDNQHTD
jgi:hypothetical protein